MKENAAIKDPDAETRIKNIKHLRALYLAHVKEQLSRSKTEALQDHN